MFHRRRRPHCLPTCPRPCSPTGSFADLPLCTKPHCSGDRTTAWVQNQASDLSVLRLPVTLRTSYVRLRGLSHEISTSPQSQTAVCFLRPPISREGQQHWSMPLNTVRVRAPVVDGP